MDLRELHRDLLKLHGQPPARETPDGVGHLLKTILSQNVTDEQRDAAFENLRAEYPDYRAVEAAPHEELADVIESAGLNNQKAERIQGALARVREETDGEYSLAFLEEMETGEAKAWLTDISGIGPKTASVVLNFHFDRATFPVDTHVERLVKRFGLVDASMGAERAHEVLEERVPDDIKYSLHMLLIEHGREYCTAQAADCSNPVCERYCDCEFC